MLLIVVGVLLEGLPSLNVAGAAVDPDRRQIGLERIALRAVLIIAMGIGGFMPLAGVGFYVCCAIMRCDIERPRAPCCPI